MLVSLGYEVAVFELTSRTKIIYTSPYIMDAVSATTELKKDDEIEVEVLTAEEQKDLPIFEEMIKAGVIYGRKKSKLNPQMKPYLYTFRNGVALFDLTKVNEAVARAQQFLTEVAKNNGAILVVATQPAAKILAKEFAATHGLLFVTERWLAGMLTNFTRISSRIEYFKKLKADRAAGKHDKHTKKERLLMDREMAKGALFFGGVESMASLPKAAIVIDAKLHETAMREAKRAKIPVVALLSSDADPRDAMYPLPGNTNARTSIAWFLERLGKALVDGKALAAKNAAEALAAVAAAGVKKV